MDLHLTLPSSEPKLPSTIKIYDYTWSIIAVSIFDHRMWIVCFPAYNTENAACLNRYFSRLK
jgi:hypothetical protein